MNGTIRDELRRHHTEILAKLDEGRRLAVTAPHQLHDLLLDLANVLRWHQLREEDALHDILPPREELEMLRAIEQHADEHKEIYDTLHVLSTADDPQTVAARAVALFDRILAHIQAETFIDAP